MWTAGTDGGVFALGGGGYYGSLGGRHLNAAVISSAATPTGRGYWLAALDGGVFTFGDAAFHGSMGGHKLNKPVVAFAATPSGHGYWLAASDGGVFTFGDAGFYGSAGGAHLAEPVAAMTRTRSGKGYWLVTRDGGVLPFGDARSYGSMHGRHLNQPISTMTASKTGHGYWLLGRDGGVFTFGDAGFHGSAADGGSAAKVGIVPSASGGGYSIVSTDDVVRAYGDAPKVSSPRRLAAPVVGLTTTWASSSGYALILLEQLRPPIFWPGPHEVALTFDDGPSSYTSQVLVALARYGVPATFFDVGYEVVARPDLARAEVRAGHAVESHSYNHPQLTHLSDAQIRDQLASSVAEIRAATGEQPNCFRPPYGDTNARVAAVAAGLGLTQILWNVAPFDYLRPGAGVIAQRVLSQANGRGLVVGIHDGGGDRSQTVAALPAIIEGLRARGYHFVRLCN